MSHPLVMFPFINLKSVFTLNPLNNDGNPIGVWGILFCLQTESCYLDFASIIHRITNCQVEKSLETQRSFEMVWPTRHNSLPEIHFGPS